MRERKIAIVILLTSPVNCGHITLRSPKKSTDSTAVLPMLASDVFLLQGSAATFLRCVKQIPIDRAMLPPHSAHKKVLNSIHFDPFFQNRGT